MANNYCQGTMTPCIPLTDEQAEAVSELESAGYGEPESALAKRWIVEHDVADFGFPSSEDDGEGGFYFYAEYGLEDYAIPVLQEILKGLPKDKYPHLIWEGSYTCDKMRPGEFGGWAVIIYRDRVESFSTAQWISEETESQKV